MINEKQLKKYCSEDISKIENYEQAVNDKTQMWDCHHRLEIQGQFRNSPELLKKCCLYYNVPAWQLIFLTKSEHRRLHRLGKHLSTETRKKLSLSCRGKSPWNKGKSLSEETKKKMSEKAKLRAPISEETRKKLSDKVIGMKYWNNGTINKRSEKCPGQGWVRGRKPR